MMKQNEGRKLKEKRAIALTEIFLMVLSSIAFAFIVGGMGVLSLEGVSAVSTSPKVVDGVTYYYGEKNTDGSINIYSDAAGTQLFATASDETHITEAITAKVNPVSVAPQPAPAAPAAPAAAPSTGTAAAPLTAAPAPTQGKPELATKNVNTPTPSVSGNSVNFNAQTLENFGTKSVQLTDETTVLYTKAIKQADGTYQLYGPDGNTLAVAPVTADYLKQQGLDPNNFVIVDGKTVNLNGADWDLYTVTTANGETDVWAYQDPTNSNRLINMDNEEVYLKQADGTYTLEGHSPPKVQNDNQEFSFLGLKKWTASPTEGFGTWVGSNVLEGVAWAGTVLTLVNTFASILPASMKDATQAFSQALSAGILTYKTLYGLTSWKGSSGGSFGDLMAGSKYTNWMCSTGTGCAQLTSGAVSVVVAYLIFASQYKKTKEKTETIEFQCMTWQAPKGGADCNKCNDNPLQPCSEYRCRSLGQTCKLINGGTGADRCINSAPSDTTSPGIKPWPEAITPGYAYTSVKERPAGESSGTSGMTISYNNGCLPAFTPFEFGIITTDTGEVTQPAQCKIDFNHTTKYDEMQYYFGESNLYEEEHSQAMSLPGTDLLSTLYGSEENESTLAFTNGGDYKLYVRCKDGNGNENRDEFVVSFCVDKSPDVTPPIIKGANPPADSPVLYQVDNASIQAYTNEPAECRWSRQDASYVNMENQMTCNNEVWEMNAEFLYTCNTVLTGIKDKQENKFYFRCQDRSAQQNPMSESYQYSLFGTQPLDIVKVGPNGTISGSTSTVTTTLTVQTDNGYKNGESRCSYSLSPTEGFIEMVNTGTRMHSQPLDLTEGNYTYYYRCIDAGGNIATNSTNFLIFVDRYAPAITRVYDFENKLTINTDENSICKYSTTSCNFDVSKEGILMPYDNTQIHYAEWKTTQNYYIKCRDSNGNQPDPTQCSITVRPYRTTNSQ